MSLDPRLLKETSSRTSFFVKVLQGPITLIPPIVTILVAVTTKNVMLSLFCGVYSASALIWNFNIFYAFINSFSEIIVESIASRDHAYIILFTWVLGGMVSCIMKSGGGEGLVNSLRSYATSPRAGALVTFCLGLLIFFDDYANTLIVGQTVLPITDSLGISREKLAFLVDATSATVASISPVSSWIGFELSLIDEVLVELSDSGEDLTCYESSAFLIFLETIPSRFYPVLMLSLQLLLILTQREFGPMLTYERKSFRKLASSRNITAPVHPGRHGNTEHDVTLSLRINPLGTSATSHGNVGDNGHISDEDSRGEATGAGSIDPPVELDSMDIDLAATTAILKPHNMTPRRWYNAVVPIVTTVMAVFAALVCTGVTSCHKNNDNLTLKNIFSYSDSFVSLLYGSVAGTICIWMMAFVERVEPRGGMTSLFREDSRACPPVMSLTESLEVFIFGIKHLTEAILILILAWAVGDAFSRCGTGTYVSSALKDNLTPGAYPALTFVISCVLAMVTGSSWGTMSIMFPLIVPAAHYADPCNKDVFYGTISAILAGTTVITTWIMCPMGCVWRSLLANVATPQYWRLWRVGRDISSAPGMCSLLNHVRSQAPYCVLAAVAAVLVGSLPCGYGAYRPGVGILLGIALTCLAAYFLSTPSSGTGVDKVTLVIEYCANKVGFAVSTWTRAYRNASGGNKAMLTEGTNGRHNGDDIQL